MRIHYFPLMGYSALDDFSLNGGWLELKAGIDLTKPQKNLKYGTLKYENGSGNLALFQG